MAQQIRTGLTPESPSVPNLRVVTGSKELKDPLEELFFRKPVRQHVKEFGGLFAAIFLFITAYRLYFKPFSLPVIGSLVGVAATFLYLGYLKPRVLHPVWKGWMAFAEKIGHVMTLVMMSITWFVVMIPTAIALNVIRKRVMNLTYKANVSTYWEERDAKQNDMKLLERQY